MKLKGTIITIIIVLIGIFIIQNTDIVVIKFLFWEIQMSRIILFSLLLAVGVIIGFSLTFIVNKK
jgi:uncharacterized integral membrane protein